MPGRKAKTKTKRKGITKAMKEKIRAGGDVPVGYYVPEQQVQEGATEVTGTPAAPEGTIKFKNGCYFKVIREYHDGHRKQDRIVYQKGWPQEDNTLKWSPEVSGPKKGVLELIEKMRK